VDDSGAPIQVRPGEVTVVLALGSGDDAIVAVARALPGHRVVVTADRELRQRCVAAGATVLGPAWLLGLLRP
jgi:8-oxo-dGTP diphosphatase